MAVMALVQGQAMAVVQKEALVVLVHQPIPGNLLNFGLMFQIDNNFITSQASMGTKGGSMGAMGMGMGGMAGRPMSPAMAYRGRAGNNGFMNRRGQMMGGMMSPMMMGGMMGKGKLA